ncbi:MAG: acetoin utilization protein AcuC [Gammaproteobacteria bacterium]|jgi:acetoin utilization protein AcuC|nr:acetoin utilization protein AcuC [Gammaproteobacteria bacterium]
MPVTVAVVAGEAIARYGFGNGHPFGSDRHECFVRELANQGLASEVLHHPPRTATREELISFHTPPYVDFVQQKSVSGDGFLDGGDTPAFRGVFEAASSVVGATLVAVESLMSGASRRAFVPIAGLHHAARDRAAGFCVFNDCGVAVEQLRCRHGIRRIAYVDIDAHHGDGMFYAFEDDPDLMFADIHEDGRDLYPGTGAAGETGKGAASGTKLNLPLPPGAGDDEFMTAWDQVEAYLRRAPAEFILFQCGADSLAGDPITHLRFSEAAHAHAARRLCAIADEQGHGRVLGLGGGGYNRRNLARAWTGVVRSFLDRDA